MPNGGKTKICKYCRTEIDAKASVCPNCKKEQNSGCMTILAGAIVAFGFLSAVNMFSKTNNTKTERGSVRIESDTNVSKVAETIPEKENITESAANSKVSANESGFSYEVTDTKFVQVQNRGNKYYGIVEITNTGTTNISMDECTFDLEDNDGHLLQTDSASACPEIIAPGEKGYFYNGILRSIDSSISLDNGINLVPTYKISETKGEIIEFDVSDTDIHESDYGQLEMTGRLTNNTGQDCSYVPIDIILYDNDKNILFITGSSEYNLTSGETKSFETILLFDKSIDREKIASYEIIARRDSTKLW